ncbi:MAG: nucleotide exchange factor GrpE, partial [Atribacterota bacterium]|nr:nucleotide exchange factor GrpE [Atribacterota bacterium]
MDNCKNTENIHEKEQAGEKKEYYKNIKKNCLIEKIMEKDKEIMQYKKDIEKIEEKLNIVENDANIYKNQLIRMQADFDNYKKREEKKKKEYIEYANKDLICQLLSVIDNLERAVSYSK